MAAFAVFWDGQTKLLLQEGAIGAVVSFILLVSAIALFREPQLGTGGNEVRDAWAPVIQTDLGGPA